MHPVIIKLPSQFNGQSMTNISPGLNGSIRENKHLNEIHFDFSTLKFIQPTGVVFLHNLIHWLIAEGIKVKFIKINGDLDSIRYLDDALFFEAHLKHKLNAQAHPRPTTLPLQHVRQADSHMWLRHTLVPWLAGRLSVTERSLDQFQASISEIFNNISDHTRHDIGCIFAQHFPNKQYVLISVADFGIGIPGSVQRVKPNLSDVDAVLQAVEEGFTSKSTPRNRGAGLDYLLRSVVLGNTGKVTIYSRRAIVMFSYRSGSIVPAPVPTSGFSPGTLIEIELKTDKIVSIEDANEEFVW